MKKEHLPFKICPICGFSFNWRRKWKKTWEDVIYCSEKCRKNKNKIDKK